MVGVAYVAPNNLSLIMIEIMQVTQKADLHMGDKNNCYENKKGSCRQK